MQSLLTEISKRPSTPILWVLSSALLALWPARRLRITQTAHRSWSLNAVELTTEVSGRVVQLNLETGRRLARGEVLLRLDDRQARADLQVIKAQLADARRQYERAQRLRSNNSISQSQVDELRTAVDVAEAQRQSARVRLENHRIQAPFAGVIGLSDSASDPISPLAPR